MTDPKPTPESLERAREALILPTNPDALPIAELRARCVARAIDAAREPLLQELREAYANGRKADRELRAQLQDEKDRVTRAAATVESVHDNSLAAGRAEARRAALEECAEILKVRRMEIALRDNVASADVLAAKGLFDGETAIRALLDAETEKKPTLMDALANEVSKCRKEAPNDR